MSSRKIEFSKYQGTGNDFIIINNYSNRFDDKFKKHITPIFCDRRFGIGADGLIFIDTDVQSDFYMDYYNPDGSQSFCGNGSRCAFKYALDQNIIHSEKSVFRAIDGFHQAYFKKKVVAVKMQDVTNFKVNLTHSYFDTGSPHYILIKPKIKTFDMVSEAKKIRYNNTYKLKGINVNFVEYLEDNNINMRTYERGVEGETLSCGTGVTAVALNSFLIGKKKEKNIKVNTKGGELVVDFEYDSNSNVFKNIYLIASAEKVFDGEIYV